MPSVAIQGKNEKKSLQNCDDLTFLLKLYFLVFFIQFKVEMQMKFTTKDNKLPSVHSKCYSTDNVLTNRGRKDTKQT